MRVEGGHDYYSVLRLEGASVTVVASLRVEGIIRVTFLSVEGGVRSKVKGGWWRGR